MNRAAEKLTEAQPLLDALDDHFQGPSVTRALGAAARDVPAEVWSRALHEPLRQFLARPGKEFRGQLVSLGWVLGGGHGKAPAHLALALEAIHAGSLIVDDIEDGSNTRRGGPALHVAYGLPLALNAGNWLYFWALNLLSGLPLSPACRAEVLENVQRVMLQCHHGQALDVGVRVEDLQQKDVFPVVNALTRLKTGALMGLATSVGARAAGASVQVVGTLQAFGDEVGTALQMLDDLGGIQNVKMAHKGLEDVRHGRATWVWASIAQSADEVTYGRLRHLAREVARQLIPGAEVAEHLRRNVPPHARHNIHRMLRNALHTLEALPGAQEVSVDVGRRLETLEKSYG